jgi:hypothetical protein
MYDNSDLFYNFRTTTLCLITTTVKLTVSPITNTQYNNSEHDDNNKTLGKTVILKKSRHFLRALFTVCAPVLPRIQVETIGRYFNFPLAKPSKEKNL